MRLLRKSNSLRHGIKATDDNAAFQGNRGTQSIKLVTNLDAKFSRWGKHQGVKWLRIIEKTLDNWDTECQSFS